MKFGTIRAVGQVISTGSALLTGSAQLTNLGYAVTGSNTFGGNQTINGSLVVTGSLTAQQFIVSSSVTYLTESFASGSHKFGDSSDDNHNFTGSVFISGSAIVTGSITTTAKISVANETIVGAQGGNDTTYIAGGSGYGSIIRNNYTTGINNELRGNGNNYLNSILGSTAIGTTNPVNTLSVRGNGDFGATGYAYAGPSQYGGLMFPRGQILFSNSNGQNQFYLSSNAYTSAAGVFAYRTAAQPALALGLDNGAMTFLTAGNGTADATISWTTAMTINNGGQVQRPTQPAFLAYAGTGFTVTGGGWYNISNAITTESYDIGSNYGTSTAGRFVAPVSGRYLFYFGGWANSASNGERYAVCATINGGGYNYIGGGNYCLTDSPLNNYNVVHNLSAGDYVDLFAFSAVTCSWGSTPHYVYWGGYLL